MGSEIDKQAYNRTSIDPAPVRSSPQSQVGWATCLEPISRSNGLHVQKNEKSVIGNDCSLWPSPQGAPWEGPLQRISLGFKQVIIIREGFLKDAYLACSVELNTGEDATEKEGLVIVKV